MGQVEQGQLQAKTGRSIRFILSRAGRRFRTSERGNVAMIVGFAMIPLAGTMGLALDYSRVSLARAELQAAVDSAGLAIAQMPRGTPLATLQTRAQEWVESSVNGKGLGQVTVTVTQAQTALDVRADSTVPTTLFSVIQRKPTALAASNQVVWDLGKVEIALVLDNTGSMGSYLGTGSTKIASLRDAATQLVSVLRNAVTQPGQVKIGIVPFSITVRVGSQYQTASWVANHQQSSINKEIFWNASGTSNPNRFNLLKAMSQTWAGCVESRPMPYDVQDTPPAAGDTVFVPFFAPDEPDVKDANGGNYQNSYLADGTTSSNQMIRQGNDAKYTTKPNNASRGPNRGCDMQPLIRLSTDLTTTGPVQKTIDGMVATGQTNIPMGLAWGWHLLSPNAPFGDGVAYDTPNVTKYVILMTDGDNTFSSNNNQDGSDYNGHGYIWQKRLGNTSAGTSDSNRTQLMDARVRAICTNMKKKPSSGAPKSSAEPDIQIYTIGVGVSSNSRKLLQDCATNTSMYYDVANASDMTPVFTRIADEISQLRLSK